MRSTARGLTLLLLGLLASPARPATAAEFTYPIAVAAAADGAIYVADRYLPGVWVIRDGRREVFFEGSKKFRTPLNAVRCLALDKDGRLLAGDSATRQIYRFDEAKRPQPLLKGPVGLGIPMTISVAKDGTIYAVDLETQRIWKTPADGGEPAEVIEIPGVRAATLDANDRLWAITNTAKAIVRVIDGKAETVLGTRTFEYPQQILIDGEGRAVVSDGYAKAIWRVDAEGKAEKWIQGDPLQHPVGIAFDKDGLLITDSKKKSVFRAGADGKVAPLPGGTP